MQVEFNEAFKKADDTFVGNKTIVAVTPPIGEDFWIFRVKLHKDQALLAFPKLFTIGIGFAKEEDWNTNLPASCAAIDIADHILHNKKYDEITREMVVEGIKLLQPHCERFLQTSN